MSDEGIFSDTDTEMEMEMAENEDMKASIKPLSLTSKFQGDFNSNMVVRSYAYPVANYKIKTDNRSVGDSRKEKEKMAGKTKALSEAMLNVVEMFLPPTPTSNVSEMNVTKMPVGFEEFESSEHSEHSEYNDEIHTKHPPVKNSIQTRTSEPNGKEIESPTCPVEFATDANQRSRKFQSKQISLAKEEFSQIISPTNEVHDSKPLLHKTLDIYPYEELKLRKTIYGEPQQAEPETVPTGKMSTSRKLDIPEHEDDEYYYNLIAFMTKARLVNPKAGQLICLCGCLKKKCPNTKNACQSHNCSTWQQN